MTPASGRINVNAAMPGGGQQLDQNLFGTVCRRRDRVGRKNAYCNGIGQTLVLEILVDQRLSQKKPLPRIDESRRGFVLVSQLYHGDALPRPHVRNLYAKLTPVNVSGST